MLLMRSTRCNMTLKLFKSQGGEVLVLDTQIDSHIIQFLKMKNSEVDFARVDAEVAQKLTEQGVASELIEGEDGKTRDEKIVDMFKHFLGEENLEVRVEKLKDESVLAMLTCRAFVQEQISCFIDRSNQLRAKVNV